MYKLCDHDFWPGVSAFLVVISNEAVRNSWDILNAIFGHRYQNRPTVLKLSIKANKAKICNKKWALSVSHLCLSFSMRTSKSFLSLVKWVWLKSYDEQWMEITPGPSPLHILLQIRVRVGPHNSTVINASIRQPDNRLELPFLRWLLLCLL